VILITADTTGIEHRAQAIRAAHKAKREFARMVSQELPLAIKAEMKFRDSIDPATGLRAALDGKGPGAIRDEQTTPTSQTVTVGVRYASVPWIWIHEYGGVIRAKNVRFLTIPATDAAARELHRAGGARNIPGLKYRPFGKRFPALVKESDPNTPFIWLKPSVTIPKRSYIAPGLKRFELTSWKRIVESVGALMLDE
jgi:hypothetical protein